MELLYYIEKKLKSFPAFEPTLTMQIVEGKLNFFIKVYHPDALGRKTTSVVNFFCKEPSNVVEMKMAFDHAFQNLELQVRRTANAIA